MTWRDPRGPWTADEPWQHTVTCIPAHSFLWVGWDPKKLTGMSCGSSTRHWLSLQWPTESADEVHSSSHKRMMSPPSPREEAGDTISGHQSAFVLASNSSMGRPSFHLGCVEMTTIGCGIFVRDGVAVSAAKCRL